MINKYAEEIQDLCKVIEQQHPYRKVLIRQHLPEGKEGFLCLEVHDIVLLVPQAVHPKR